MLFYTQLYSINNMWRMFFSANVDVMLMALGWVEFLQLTFSGLQLCVSGKVAVCPSAK